MSQPDPPSSSHSNQAQQSGGVSFGAYNQFRDVLIGDQISIQTFQLIVYTGDAHPHDPAMRADLLRAYRSEVAARYAVWKTRYATLPLVAQVVVAPHPFTRSYEREELSFLPLRHAFSSAPHAPETHIFTDLRDGLTRYGHLLLLGPPGGGKTTALWRLALDLAEAGLAGADSVPLPVFVRLGGLQPGQSLPDLLKADLASASLEDAHGLRFSLTAHRNLAGLLETLLEPGQLVLLWDGLNEVPRSRFAESAHALDAFRRAYPGRLGGTQKTQSVTTCRADDYALLCEEGGADPYPVQGVIIQGLDPATIRQVVIGRLGAGKGAALLDALNQPEHAALAGLARTPLLLTMLCEVYDEAGALPRNRGQLLEQFVAQRWVWEQQRNPEGWIDAKVQESALARLAYAITENAGRGTSVPRAFAEQHLRVSGGSSRSADLLRLARSADLLELLDDSVQVRFTHHLVQEHFAAVALRAKLRSVTKWESMWKSILLLFPYLFSRIEGIIGEWNLYRFGKRITWEGTLLQLEGIDGEGSLAQKIIRAGDPVREAQRILASDFPPSLELETKISERLTAISRHPTQNQDRRRVAGSLYGQLQHRYLPITQAAWQREFQRRNERFGAPDGYFCYVPNGRYRIGGWKKDAPTVEHDVAAFWVARVPVTVAQYAPFVSEGYGKDAEGWWTTAGWQWKQAQKRTKPWGWGEPRFSGANQPVIGVMWDEAMAFCHWLTEQLVAVMPANHELRLPTEAEWEVAAAYDGTATRRTYPWGKEEATPERAVYDAWELDAPASVGLCPAGAAACGALDVAGNVWEWCASHAETYPQAAHTLQKDFTVDDWVVPLRGGSWYCRSTGVRCGARDRYHPVYVRDGSLGVRVVVSLARTKIASVLKFRLMQGVSVRGGLKTVFQCEPQPENRTRGIHVERATPARWPRSDVARSAV